MNFGFKPASGVGKIKMAPGHMFAPEFDKTVKAMRVNKGGFGARPRGVVRASLKLPRRVVKGKLE